MGVYFLKLFLEGLFFTMECFGVSARHVLTTKMVEAGVFHPHQVAKS